MFLRFSFLIFSSLLLPSCSQNFNSAIESVKVAIEQSKGTSITPEYIESVPYASTLVRVNDGSPIFLVLAFADKNTYNDSYKLTWVDAEQGFIVTENGRIIHTTGFTASNLENLTPSLSNLPTFQYSSIKSSSNNNSLNNSASQWSAIYDWSPGYRYNFTAEVTQTLQGLENVSSELWQKQAAHITETVIFDSLDSQFINHFWVIEETENTPARVIKSIQHLGPNMDKVEMTIMKHYSVPKSEEAAKK